MGTLSVHQRGLHCFSSPQQRETESQSWTELGECSESGLFVASPFLFGALQNWQRRKRPGHGEVSAAPAVSSVPCPHPLSRGDPRRLQGAEEPRHLARGGVCFASGVQAEARGGERCRGVLRPPLTGEERCESPGKHPHAASPSPCLRPWRLRARHLGLWGAQCPGHPVTPRGGARGAGSAHPARLSPAAMPTLPSAWHAGQAGQERCPAPGRPDMNSASPRGKR